MLVLFPLEHKTVPNVAVRFAGLILVELGLAPLHSTAGFVNLGGETAVEDFIASQAPQTASEESE